MSITPFFHVYHKYVFIMSNISKIKISGTSYNLKDENACNVVELTQAQYDDLPTSAKTSNSLFVITDATAGDLSNYYTKTETDNAITAATSTKQDTLVSGTNIKTINGETLLGEGNITIQGGSGGGKSIEAGRGISITTGETADTVSFNLPISAGTGTGSIIEGFAIPSNGMYTHAEGMNTKANGIASHAEGMNTSANGSVSHTEGTYTNANGDYSHAEGSNTNANGNYSHAEGSDVYAGGNYSHAEGNGTITNNASEHASGQYNNSVSASTTFGDSGNTLFSVGNGTENEARHNAFEIRQNGDIYITKDGQDVKLQDQLGGGGSSYTAGDGIDINNDVISVTGKVDTSTYETYTAATDTALASKQTTLTAGTGISIVDNVISATGGSGGESCTVDSNTIFYSFSRKYSNNELDMRVRYVVLDYAQHKTDTPNVSINVNFRDDNYNTYVNQNINLDYSTSSYTLGDISQAEYIDVTYDSTINDFKIAVATAYTSTVFVNSINFWEGKIKVPFYTISSGSPCTVIENDIPTAISELSDNMLKGLGTVSIIPQQDAISIYTEKLDGNGISNEIKLDEIDGSNSTLKPDIYVGLGTSGWTEINLSQQCYIDSLKATKYRVTYNYSEFNAVSMGLQIIVEYARNLRYDYVDFDNTQQPSLQTIPSFSAATVDWNASTKELVITYPETVELDGKQESVKISRIHSNNCQFGKAITKLESYGEAKQALKPYVKETRAALGGLKLVKLTQSEYDSLTTKDNSTLYVIVN